MTQKGEASLLAILSVVVLVSVVLLSTLELRRSYKLLQKRTDLFLCTKEFKGEHLQFMRFMGQTNWAIVNIQRAQLIMYLIPGLQGVAASSGKARKVIKLSQYYKLVSYLKQLHSMQARRCPLDPRVLITPFELTTTGFKRDLEGAAKLREKEWTYVFLNNPYLLELTVNASGFQRLKPKVKAEARERAAKLSSLLSSHSL
jgi:hypothetical protein